MPHFNAPQMDADAIEAMEAAWKRWHEGAGDPVTGQLPPNASFAQAWVEQLSKQFTSKSGNTLADIVTLLRKKGWGCTKHDNLLGTVKRIIEGYHDMERRLDTIRKAC